MFLLPLVLAMQKEKQYFLAGEREDVVEKPVLEKIKFLSSPKTHQRINTCHRLQNQKGAMICYQRSNS